MSDSDVSDAEKQDQTQKHNDSATHDPKQHNGTRSRKRNHATMKTGSNTHCSKRSAHRRSASAHSGVHSDMRRKSSLPRAPHHVRRSRNDDDDNFDRPSNDSDRPGNDSDRPSNDSDRPGNDSDRPGNDSDTNRRPLENIDEVFSHDFCDSIKSVFDLLLDEGNHPNIVVDDSTTQENEAKDRAEIPYVLLFENGDTGSNTGNGRADGSGNTGGDKGGSAGDTEGGPDDTGGRNGGATINGNRDGTSHEGGDTGDTCKGGHHIGDGEDGGGTLPKSCELESEAPYVYQIDETRPIDIIERDIDTLDDLIAVGYLREESDFRKKNYTVNVDGLHKMIPALQEFQSMVGLQNIKKQVVDQIVYLSGKNHTQYRGSEDDAAPFSEPSDNTDSMSLLTQLLTGKTPPPLPQPRSEYSAHDSVLDDDTAHDMFHTCIYGPPGVGKTAFAKILARVFLSLGITKTDKFKIASRSDLVGEYVGHTAVKTQKVIDEAAGGVLFIDEVYSLGNGGSSTNDSRSDSFSHEAINTLMQNLSQRKGEFICIIAGYREETERHFFGLNPGLRRRFSFYYNITGYDWEELSKILIFKVERLRRWSLTERAITFLLRERFLEKHIADFPNFAGDIETLLLNVKISHCKRVFGKDISLQRRIEPEDLRDGHRRFIMHKHDDEKKKEQDKERLALMYT